MRIYLFLILWFTFLSQAFSQNYTITGSVIDENRNGLSGAVIFIEEAQKSTVSGFKGDFQLQVPPGDYLVSVKYLGYFPQDTSLNINGDIDDLVIQLFPDPQLLDEVRVSDNRFSEEDPTINVTRLESESIKNLPSAFGDFSRVLVTLPGVSSNNELSSGYSVRGGNFDENLVYVNDIPVYRPFLSNAGQQEGLSFVNPDLVEDVSFYAGGWEAKYGDKLSSSLNIEYKSPIGREGSAAVGLLGGSAYYGHSNKSESIKYIVGVRHRDSRYLLNTLEVEGQYFPTYTDAQALLTFDLSGKSSNQVNKTVLNWLLSYNRNRYLTLPESQTTEFGSVTRNLRIQTAFQGREELNYDTYQTGFRLRHRFNNSFSTQLIGSMVSTREVENYEVEGAYRLCDIDNDPGSSTFDECVVVRGVGSQYDYGRNKLNAEIVTGENRYEWYLNEHNILEGGAGITYQNIRDELNEYTFNDSADFVDVTYSSFNKLSLQNFQFFQFLQWEHFSKDSLHLFNLGIRSTYWSENNEWLISPRFQYQYRPRWNTLTRFNFSVGSYQQPPFYRELRNRRGVINRSVLAQKSIHLIGGMDQFLTFWGRPFVLTTQAYYKYLYDLTPYEIDNVRLRYYASNNSTGYTAGIDTRINGEFIKGTQSWFSLGYLRSMENIRGDDRGNIRRPLDQRINLGVYFEDHMPMDSTLRIYVNLVFGSGYPVGPPNNAELRNVFSGDEYYRADLGISKDFYFIEKGVDRLVVRLEVLNALAADNTLSYTWIEDVTGTSFAIPNSLSARFFNVKFILEL